MCACVCPASPLVCLISKMWWIVRSGLPLPPPAAAPGKHVACHMIDRGATMRVLSRWLSPSSVQYWLVSGLLFSDDLGRTPHPSCIFFVRCWRIYRSAMTFVCVYQRVRFPAFSHVYWASLGPAVVSYCPLDYGAGFSRFLIVCINSLYDSRSCSLHQKHSRGVSCFLDSVSELSTSTSNISLEPPTSLSRPRLHSR